MTPRSKPPDPELPWSWHKSLGWRGQLARLRRWRRRLHATHDLQEAEDVLYAFFQNCYHFRDWLVAEAAVPQVDIDRLFAAHTELRLAGDICNATKHLTLSRPKQPREFSLAREYRGPRRGWFGLEESETFVVLSDGAKYEALELADTCMEI
jgi:hypothetical protein